MTDEVRVRCPRLREFHGRELVVGVRPEHLEVEPPAAETLRDATIDGVVEMVETLGFAKYAYVRTDFAAPDNFADGSVRVDGDHHLLVARADSRVQVRVGSKIHMRVARECLHFFDPSDLRSIRV